MFAACTDLGPRDSPTVSASFAPSPNNNLSALVNVTTTRADSVRVIPAAGSASFPATPYFFDTSGTTQVPVLGLRASSSYSIVAEAVGARGMTQSQPITLSTGDLPESLRSVRITTLKGTPTTGFNYAALDIGHDAFAVAFDSTGEIAWYRLFPNGAQSGAFAQQPNGNYTIFLGVSHGWEATTADTYIEFTPAGDEVRRWRAPAPFFTDSHELILTVDSPTSLPVGHLLAYSIRTTDLTSIGGPADTQVAQHTLHRITAAGATELVWDSWDHFTLSDWVEPPKFPPFDIDHSNSLQVLSDGSYVVSWRNVGEITKIDRSGHAIWRFGGPHNEFTISGDPLGGFSAQHYARITSQGTMVLYDNGWRHSPPESRGVEYRLDESAKTATMIREFRHDTPIFTPYVGSAQRLANGNTLIGWGMAVLATEYSPSGAVVWEGRVEFPSGATPVFYRLLRTYSLYRDATP
jgi:Arylsulfotransferase (ASST)